ncbi:Telomere repeat-binding factor 4 [Acorus gramineus]|uniref:Telomere repeat-binding factor 4 n=1 Tax=Acorus gramineus TaxID=55184 RepID=A0AAV9ALW1_ACOGR|nr:Telomere repeat-binding factor 4 [Acorus gramineus]KAK1265126.1 Telomere repeat-binding factor 4 [Acorus gramineus]
MGAPKQKWTTEEEEALRAGVDKHGAGKWRTIQKDPEFSNYLSARSNIDLKDKWRNMSVSASGGQGSRERIRTPKAKVLPVMPFSGPQNAVASASCSVKQEPETVAESSKSTQDGNVPPRYTSMVIEALSTMLGSNGCEIGAICDFIVQRYDVPLNFRRLLSSKLRRLVAQNKIEKVHKGYKLKDSSFATKTPTPKQKDPTNRLRDELDDDSIAAAYRTTDADSKTLLVQEAMKEAERIARLSEDAENQLMLAEEILDRCRTSHPVVAITAVLLLILRISHFQFVVCRPPRRNRDDGLIKWCSGLLVK